MVILGIPCILSISNLASILLFCVKIPNPGLQKRHIPHPDKPIGETRQWISFFRVLSMSRSQWGSGTTKKSTVNSLLTDTCLTRTPGVGPCRFLVNYTLHKTDTSLRRTTTVLKRSNRQWTHEKCFMQWKIRQKRNVHALHDSKLQDF